MRKRIIIETLIIFVLTFIFSLLFNDLTTDDIWNYGFAYNITNKLIPYNDFNMVTTPLYPMLNAIIMMITTKNIIIIYLINSIITTIIYYLLKRNNNNSYKIAFLMLLLILSPNYNILCLLFLYILIELEKKQSNDYLIGVILGLTFITKQNIGFLLCIPTLFTKDIKKVFKRFAGFIIPTFLLITYLYITKSLLSFIDYCFLGISEFGNNNKIITPLPLTIIISLVLCLVYNYYKQRDIRIIYLICFLGISYPIMDTYHFIISIIPTINYLLNKMNMHKKTIDFFFLISIVIVSTYKTIELFDKNIYLYPNETKTFKYNRIDKKTANEIIILSNYYKNCNGETFFINSSGYIMKLESNKPISKYDMLLNGNNGKNGNKKNINEIKKICKTNNCYFWLNNDMYNTKNYTQYNKELHKYIIENYKYKEKILGLDIYHNSNE